MLASTTKPKLAVLVHLDPRSSFQTKDLTAPQHWQQTRRGLVEGGGQQGSLGPSGRRAGAQRARRWWLNKLLSWSCPGSCSPLLPASHSGARSEFLLVQGYSCGEKRARLLGGGGCFKTEALWMGNVGTGVQTLPPPRKNHPPKAANCPRRKNLGCKEQLGMQLLPGNGILEGPSIGSLIEGLCSCPTLPFRPGYNPNQPSCTR